MTFPPLPLSCVQINDCYQTCQPVPGLSPPLQVGSQIMNAGRQSAGPAPPGDSLDPLPLDLQREVLQRVKFSARLTCKAFRAHHDAACVDLCLRWPASTTGKGQAEEYACVRLLLARLPQLQSLKAAYCPPRCFSFIALPNLTCLALNRSYEVRSLQPLAQCTSLTLLNLSSCTAVSSIKAICSCARLMSLDLTTNAGRHTRITDLHLLGTLSALTSLSLRGQSAVSNVAFL